MRADINELFVDCSFFCQNHSCRGPNRVTSSSAPLFLRVLSQKAGGGESSRTTDEPLQITDTVAAETTTEQRISDEALLVRLQEGDLEALGSIYRRYVRRVYSICVTVLRNPTEAEDQVHETFLRLYRKRDLCGRPGSKKLSEVCRRNRD
jgi:hypothetical protein